MKKYEQLFEYFLREHYESITIDDYLRVVRKFTLKCPGYIKFSYLEILDYVHEIRLQRGHAYLSREVSAIKKFYKFLYLDGHISNHPCQTLRSDSRKKKGKRFSNLFSKVELDSFLDLKEERYIFNAARNKMLISLIITQGLMPAEICKLRIQDLDWSSDTPSIKIGGSKKLSKRKLHLKPEHLSHYEEYVEIRKKFSPHSNYLFLSLRGNRLTVDALNGLLVSLKPLGNGKKVNCLRIRESVIANWINLDKIPMEMVQYMAGHKWPSTTEKFRNPNNLEVENKILIYHPMNY